MNKTKEIILTQEEKDMCTKLDSLLKTSVFREQLKKEPYKTLKDNGFNLKNGTNVNIITDNNEIDKDKVDKGDIYINLKNYESHYVSDEISSNVVGGSFWGDFSWGFVTGFRKMGGIAERALSGDLGGAANRVNDLKETISGKRERPL